MTRVLLFLAVSLALAGCFPRRDWLDTGQFTDADGDGYGEAEDCDPDDPGVHPGAAESCNGVDDDCDGLVDDADDDVMGTTTWSWDDDGDGFGASGDEVEACEPPTGAVNGATDCDDSDPDIHPEADEVCDGVDNDCDGDVDLDASDATEWFRDEDEDGWGTTEWSHWGCEEPTGFEADSGDCDDDDPEINPGATELCDGVDNDCDGQVDNDVDGVFYRDRDSDGYGDPDVMIEQCPAPSGYVADATDCDDGDGSIHPDATEYCDGDDHDCDGLTLEADAIDAPEWYADGDADGYGDASSATTACEQPSGWVEDSADCDDGDPAVHPAAYDWCGDYADGVDDDCDGTADNPHGAWDFHEDADGDGYGASDVAYTGCAPPTGMTTDASDCDDTVAAANPGGTERYGWGIDYDCDGDLVHSEDDAHAVLLGSSAGDAAGGALAMGDIDGDGAVDLVVAAAGHDGGGSGAGAVWLLLSTTGIPSGDFDLGSSSLELLGSVAGDAAGQAVVLLGDLDGDGLDELVVGAPGHDDPHTEAGAVFLISGATLTSGAGSLSLSYADGAIWGENLGDAAGSCLASAGDDDGDGLDDLWVGATGYDSAAGAVYLVHSPAAAEFDLSMASAVLEGEAAADQSGPVAGGGDVDGDGQPDLLVGAPGNDEPGTQAGRVYLFLGPVSGTQGLVDADLILEGEAAQAYAGQTVRFVGDADGDGLDDALIGSPGGSSGAWTAGSAYLVSASTMAAQLGGTISLAGADASFDGEATADNAGWSVAGGGDFDGDGAPDFLVGAVAEDDLATDAGAVYLVPGPVRGSEDLATAWVKLGSHQASAALGTDLRFLGDLDSDGLDDLLVGVPGDDTAGTAAGAALLFYGGEI